jgi:chromosome condensin MukBEF MukE localization factor
VAAAQAVEEKGAKVLPARWLSELKARVGKCIMFGLSEEQLGRAGEVLEIASRDWKDLVVGSEGFLTDRGRAGLLGHSVVWGEMDVMVCFVCLLLFSRVAIYV